ncbi:hypothetical protein NKR19_g9521 [Coniochaeta hoffmannii]|uniref:Uncharacterized protein n=1 Tax=Coniochaeta hoffmannii TaxID=91930 RepID=A0AA38RIR6_9PEZI|nr:hypothetical protein NKR19_g9521 [Coniochaeta hoffmannii]
MWTYNKASNNAVCFQQPEPLSTPGGLIALWALDFLSVENDALGPGYQRPYKEQCKEALDCPNVTIAYADIARVVKQLADTQRDTFVVNNNDHPNFGRLPRAMPGRAAGRKDFRAFTTATTLPRAVRHPPVLGAPGRIGGGALSGDGGCRAAGVAHTLRCLARFCRK